MRRLGDSVGEHLTLDFGSGHDLRVVGLSCEPGLLKILSFSLYPPLPPQIKNKKQKTKKLIDFPEALIQVYESELTGKI